MTRLGNLRACARLQVPLSRIFAGLDADCPTRPLMPPPISVAANRGPPSQLMIAPEAAITKWL
jgi:hypothetical protein